VELGDIAGTADTAENPTPTEQDLIERHLDRTVVKKDCLEITFAGHETSPPQPPLVVRWSPVPYARRREIILPSQAADPAKRPIRPETRARLVERIAKARLWLEELVCGSVDGTK
jgi:hypothetical protein